MKKKLTLLLVLLLVCFTATACFGNGEQDETTTVSETTTTVSEATTTVSEATTTAPETTTAVAETTVTAPEQSGEPEAVAREQLYVYLDGVVLNDAGFAYADIEAAMNDITVGENSYYGAAVGDIAAGVDMSTVKGVFFEATDGFISYADDPAKAYVGAFSKSGEEYTSVEYEGQALYAGVIDGGMTSEGVNKVYLVTTAADWSVDIQVDGTSVGTLTMADFMHKTPMPEGRVATGLYDGSFMYAAGSATYEGKFLGFGFDQMVAKLKGKNMAIPENIADVEFYGVIGTGSEGKNEEYSTKPDNDKYFGAVSFYAMFDGKTYNDIAGMNVGLTAFINGSGLRWVTANLNTINFITAEESAEPITVAVTESTTSTAPEPTTAAVTESTTSTAPEPTTAAVAEPATSAAPEPTTAAVAEPATSAAPEPTTAAVAEPTAPAAPEAVAREQLYVYLDGVALNDAGFAYADIEAVMKDITVGENSYYGAAVGDIAAGVDMSTVKGVFFEATDGFISYADDPAKAYVGAFSKSGEEYTSVEYEGQALYAGVIDGGMTSEGVNKVYLVTTAADWSVDIQVDGTSVGTLTMADFMHKTPMPEGRVATGLYDGSFMYAAGSATYEGKFLGFGFDQMVAKLKGKNMAIPENIADVEYYGVVGTGSEGKNEEYSTKPDTEKYFGAVSFYAMFDGKTYNDIVGQNVGLTVFTNGSGLRWVTANLNTINFITAE